MKKSANPNKDVGNTRLSWHKRISAAIVLLRDKDGSSLADIEKKLREYDKEFLHSVFRTGFRTCLEDNLFIRCDGGDGEAKLYRLPVEGEVDDGEESGGDELAGIAEV